MSRQINEMVRITNFQGTLLNSKSEWNAPPIVRIIAESESDRRSRQYASRNIDSVQPTTENIVTFHKDRRKCLLGND